MKTTFKGYVQPNGTVGVRNHVLVLPTVSCAAHAAALTAKAAGRGRSGPEIIAVTHQHGCSQVGDDVAHTRRTLVGIGSNPNVAAVLVVGLGCSTVNAPDVTRRIARTGKPVESVVIQQEGGTTRAVAKARKILERLVAYAASLKRTEVPVEKLIVGTECGGSDACSGLSANPAVGHAADMIVKAGGTVILSETTEFIGAEHILAARAAGRKVAGDILEIVRAVEEEANRIGADVCGGNPAPGNLTGGISTIAEKSLGCIFKGGTTPIRQVVPYAVRPTRRGLVIMDTPGNDVESVCGMVAGGAQVVVFTTGRGTPIGSPVAPVIKIASNTPMYENMKDNMDINAGTIIDGKKSIADVGGKIFEAILRVASGKRTRAEILGHREFALHRIARTF